MAAFSVAVNKSKKDTETNEWKTKTIWFNCIAFKYTAESAERIVTKGAYIYVDGNLDSKFTDVGGIQQESFTVIANEVKLLEKRQMDKQQSFDELHSKATAAKKADAVDPKFDDNLDDIAWPQ